jgi:hypothetical protein
MDKWINFTCFLASISLSAVFIHDKIAMDDGSLPDRQVVQVVTYTCMWHVHFP